jgi:purine-binding chemotaxis protein CheW
VVPVVDLIVKFGLEERAVTKTTCIVIVEGQLEEQSTTMGILADAVNQVLDLTAEDIQPVPEFGTRVKVDYLLGMAKLGKKFALLLDVDKVLSTDELLNLGDVSELAENHDGTEPGAESEAASGGRESSEHAGSEHEGEEGQQ